MERNVKIDAAVEESVWLSSRSPLLSCSSVRHRRLQLMSGSKVLLQD
jgi:hypothetical protein